MEINETTLLFNSAFESGNLRNVYKVKFIKFVKYVDKVNNFEYNLIIDFDFMNDCYSEWFYFAVANISPGNY